MLATFVCTSSPLRANALRASRNPLHRFEEARFVLEVDARRQHPRCPILNGDLGMSRFQAAYNNLTQYGPVSKIAKGYKFNSFASGCVALEIVSGEVSGIFASTTRSPSNVTVAPS